MAQNETVPHAQAADERRDDVGAKIGMWLFLYTELILFGGMFLVYAVFFVKYRPQFLVGSKELALGLGAANTAILLTSSLTMALAIGAVQRARKRLSVGLLIATIALACAFFANKYVEWSHKIDHGIYPNSPALLEREHGEIMFFGLYYVMTGLHALHVVIGAVTLAVMAVFVARGRIHAERHVMLENAGLYWHLVDLIWIYLFPLFYLVR